MRVLRGSRQPETWFREGCHITEWSNSPADPDCSIARARVPAGSKTRWHRLEDSTERYVILEGRGRAEIGDEAPLELGPGDVLVIEAGERQRITSLGPCDLVFLAVCTPRFRPEAYHELGLADERRA